MGTSNLRTPRTALVMRASGFVGSHITRQLVGRGDVYYCVVEARAMSPDPAPLIRTRAAQFYAQRYAQIREVVDQ